MKIEFPSSCDSTRWLQAYRRGGFDLYSPQYGLRTIETRNQGNKPVHPERDTDRFLISFASNIQHSIALYREYSMKYHLAAVNSAPIESLYKHKPPYILESFISINADIIKYAKSEHCKSFLLDSGAFTFLNKGSNKAVNWDHYLENYANFINEHCIEHFFELDIYKLIGIAQTEQLRNRLITLTGKQPIPVWHKLLGKEYYLDLIKEFDYVALGGIAIKDIPKEHYKYFAWFIKKAESQGVDIHLLGWSPGRKALNLKPHSCDSARWIHDTRHAHLQRFDAHHLKYIRDRDVRLDPRKTNDIYDYAIQENVKYQRYLDTL